MDLLVEARAHSLAHFIPLSDRARWGSVRQGGVLDEALVGTHEHSFCARSLGASRSGRERQLGFLCSPSETMNRGTGRRRVMRCSTGLSMLVTGWSELHVEREAGSDLIRVFACSVRSVGRVESAADSLVGWL